MNKALVVSIAFILAGATASAQSRLPGQWSLMISDGGVIIPMGGMTGTLADFKREFLLDYNSTSYPFGDANAQMWDLAGLLAYRFPESPFSLNSGLRLLVFSAQDQEDLTSASNAMALACVSWSLGGEYTLGAKDVPIEGFVRAGINVNVITGYIVYNTANMAGINLAWREGFEIDAGGRYHIPFLPLSIEAGASYMDLHVLGKSYEQPPSFSITNPVRQRGLNDDANPNDSSDQSREISLLSIHLGLRLWF